MSASSYLPATIKLMMEYLEDVTGTFSGTERILSWKDGPGELLFKRLFEFGISPPSGFCPTVPWKTLSSSLSPPNLMSFGTSILSMSSHSCWGDEEWLPAPFAETRSIWLELPPWKEARPPPFW